MKNNFFQSKLFLMQNCQFLGANWQLGMASIMTSGKGKKSLTILLFWICSQRVWYWLKPYLRLLSIESNYFPKIGNVNGFSFRKHNQSSLGLSRPRRLRSLMLLWQSIPDWRENSGALPLTCSWMRTSRLCLPASTRTTMMRCWTGWTMFLSNISTR